MFKKIKTLVKYQLIFELVDPTLFKNPLSTKMGLLLCLAVGGS